ncbi:uncharacterized protein ASCRUDRAFT_84139 [Ascoidea rubescens DSM 1968]|uniref:Uncharacterized protein n=1 Tax=Ascoidea rubescens DSM 1968 TaxID=1344418 RepID=A0A1D2VRW3_9ASCO|nr:hypothetical protein ASCRUDRAFT_84139 [Ascoidea rubescens DSM 1968]ODV64317.1 hypothetical protein ASCRUDRAFT_84139 [Ascoidea rubescens DSM 1968]
MDSCCSDFKIEEVGEDFFKNVTLDDESSTNINKLENKLLDIMIISVAFENLNNAAKLFAQFSAKNQDCQNGNSQYEKNCKNKNEDSENTNHNTDNIFEKNICRFYSHPKVLNAINRDENASKKNDRIVFQFIRIVNKYYFNPRNNIIEYKNKNLLSNNGSDDTSYFTNNDFTDYDTKIMNFILSILSKI